MCMGRALDMFHNMVIIIIEHPVLVVCEMDMMSIFGEILDKLPPFKKLWYHMWK